MTFRWAALWVFLGPAVLFSAAASAVAPLPFPLKAHGEWWKSQTGRSAEDWSRALGRDYRNRNSGPACVEMLLHYKKRAAASLDYGSFADRRFPKVHSEVRWLFCRANQDKGYRGGFADDDEAEASVDEMTLVLEGEDIPVFPLSSKSEATVERLVEAVGRKLLVVCRVDPSAYFQDESTGGGRWVVVFGADEKAVSLHDPGRVEGKALRVSVDDFRIAIARADGGRTFAWLECAVFVGNYNEGWHADGRSRAFIEGFRKHRDKIGIPSDPGGTVGVHDVGPSVVQDFQQDAAKPHFGKTGSSLLFLDSKRLVTFLLKGELRDAYLKVWGFDNLGSPVSDEVEIGRNRRQDFEYGYLLWDGGKVIVASAVTIRDIKKFPEGVALEIRTIRQ